jgi:hypothetical protein
MVDLRFNRAWHFEPGITPDPVHAIRPNAKNPGDASSRLMRRTLGRRDTWEALPRLAGVPGALPEILGTED